MLRTRLAPLLKRAAAAAAGATTVAVASPVASTEEAPPLRVLVTGFLDWRELEKGNVWRCRDNPSCRLLLGAPCTTPPIVRGGPLPQQLAATCTGAEFTFQVLPTLWGTTAGIDLLAFDVVIHMGLGVYDSHDHILLEHGAYNMRARPDAAGADADGQAIEYGASMHLVSNESMLARYASVLRGDSDKLAGDYALCTAAARPTNTYICNEAHYRALKAVAAASQEGASPPASPASSSHNNSNGGRIPRLRAAYFVHLPYPREHDPGHVELAAAVAELVGRIVRTEQQAAVC